MTELDTLNLNLANTEKSLQEAEAELATTTDEHTATVKYLDDIEPGCTFIQTNYDARKRGRRRRLRSKTLSQRSRQRQSSRGSSRRRRRRLWASARRSARVRRSRRPSARRACRACLSSATA